MKAADNASHLPRRFSIHRTKERGAPSSGKRKPNPSFLPPNPQRDGISTGKRRTSPPAASLVSSAFLEKTIFFFAFLFYAALYFT